MPTRLLALSIAAIACTALVAAPAPAETQYRLGGNARLQIGPGLPIPVTGQPPPNGRILAHDAALVEQTSGPDPKRLRFASGQLAANGQTFTIPVGHAQTLPLRSVFQLRTRLPIRMGAGTFSAGGRTGPATFTFTPGAVPGNMVYRALGNQFGGVAQARGEGGTLEWAVGISTYLLAYGACTNLATNACQVNFANGRAPDTFAQGGPFGFFSMVTPPIPGTASGAIWATVISGGLIGNYSPIPGSGFGNTVTSYGGPWTTGQVVVSQPGGGGFATLTGSDGRVNGVGSISLVSGALSARPLHFPFDGSADRGWLNLTVTELPEPTAALGAAGALAVLALCHGLARRRPRP